LSAFAEVISQLFGAYNCQARLVFMQEQARAKLQEERERAEAAQAAEALCSGLNLSDALAEGSDVKRENAEEAPLSLLTGTCVDATGDPAAGAADSHDAPTFEPEPYTVADIQVCHEIMLRRRVQEKAEHQASCKCSDQYLDKKLFAPLILSTSIQTFAANMSFCLRMQLLKSLDALAVSDCEHRPAAVSSINIMHGSHDALHG
jgi:hypothetical protein